MVVYLLVLAYPGCPGKHKDMFLEKEAVKWM